jgi:hypothetical protein
LLHRHAWVWAWTAKRLARLRRRRSIWRYYRQSVAEALRLQLKCPAAPLLPPSLPADAAVGFLALVYARRPIRRDGIPLGRVLCVLADLLSGHRRLPSGSASRHSRCLHHPKPGIRGQAGRRPQQGPSTWTAMLPLPGKSSGMSGGTTIFLPERRALLRHYSWSCSAREQSGVCRFQDGLARTAVLPQLKVDRLCSVVGGTVDFDPKPTEVGHSAGCSGRRFTCGIGNHGREGS